MSEHFFFFGCLHSSGHSLYERGQRILRSQESKLPRALRAIGLDDSFSSIQGLIPGQIVFTTISSEKESYSIISMIDLSLDSRTGSNCSFFTNSIKTKEEMIELFKIHYPIVFNRINTYSPIF